MANTPFSRRYGYTDSSRAITIREDAPGNLRWFVLQTALEQDIQYGQLRLLLCKRLRRVPADQESDWEIREAVQEMFYGSAWYSFYDIVEDIYRIILAEDSENFRGGRTTSEVEREPARAPIFEHAVNQFCIDEGIGWQLADGQIVTRGEEAFEGAVKAAQAALGEAGRQTAAGRIHDALQALSRRPEADYTGAISHAMAALEALARDVTGERTRTLGQLIAQGRLNILLSENIRECIKYAWKYACDEGARHGREGAHPAREDAELVVGLTAMVASYLNSKNT